MGERDDRDQTARDAAPHGSRLRDRVARIDERLQLPMAVLGLVWVALLVADLVWGTPAWSGWLSSGIWALFIAEFALHFALARDKSDFLRDNWFTALSLLLPGLRVFSALRAMRAASAVRGLQLARVVARLGTAKRTLATMMRRHGLRYVFLLTTIITFGGAAGMFAFERGREGFATYADSLWWTAMLISTIASQYWPVTVAGRVLAVLLSGYALGVMGFITAALASFLIGHKSDGPQSEVAGERSIDALRAEIAKLAAQVERLAARGDKGPPSGADDP